MKVQEESPKEMAKNKNNKVQNKEQNNQSSPHKSGDLTPRPLCILQDIHRRSATDQLPSLPPSLILYKEMDAEEPLRSSSPVPSASRKLCKRKLSESLLLLLPPLLQDPGELPLPPKLPCLANDQNLGTLQSTLQSKKALEDKTEGTVDSSATQSAPSIAPPGSVMADTLPLATQTGQGSATITAREAAALTSQPVFDDEEDIQMDVTPPCYAATIIPSPDSNARFMPGLPNPVQCGAQVPSSPSAGLPALKGCCPTSGHPLCPQSTLQPTR